MLLYSSNILSGFPTDRLFYFINKRNQAFWHHHQRAITHWLYAKGSPVPWRDVNLLGWRHLNSHCVAVPLVLRDRPERVWEIRRRCELLPQALQRDPAFAITSPN
jgi:hypothetical protein